MGLVEWIYQASLALLGLSLEFNSTAPLETRFTVSLPNALMQLPAFRDTCENVSDLSIAGFSLVGYIRKGLKGSRLNPQAASSHSTPFGWIPLEEKSPRLPLA